MNESIGLLICCGVLFFYFFTGRIIASHTVFGRNFSSTGLNNIYSAFGLWYFVALAATVLDINLQYAWWGFTSLTVLLYIFFLSSRHEKLPSEHSLTIPITILIFLAPALYFTIGDVATEVTEITTHLRNAFYITETGHVPNATAEETYDLKSVIAPQGFTLSLLPAFIFKGEFSESYFAIFNIILLSFAANGMAKLTDVQVRWSNLALVSISSIFAITALNPFFQLSTITSATPSFIFAAGILAAITPLCRHKNLPTGLGALPTAFILSALISIHEMGAYASAIIIALWVLRTLFEKKEFVDTFFSITILIALPAISWHLWAFHTQEIALENILSNISPNIFNIVQNELSSFALIALTAVLILLIIEIISVKSYTHFKDLFTKNSWLTMPILFTFVYMLIGMGDDNFNFIEHLQFIPIIPLWYVITSWYKGSKWKELAYHSPWAIALSIAVIFMSLQSIASNSIQQRHSDASLHVLNTSKLLEINILKEGDNIAVLENDKDQKYYANLMRYGLTSHKGKVLNVNTALFDSGYNSPLFHLKLKENGFQYLWIHSPTPLDKKWLGRFLKTDRSYLFKVTNTSLRLIKIFPHPSYNHTNL